MKESPTIEKFIASCESLDTRIIEPYLSENSIINGLNKYSFLSYLHKLFTEARSNEVMNLVMVKKYCKICHPNVDILEFYSKEREVQHYRYLPSAKKIKPVFAFAILNKSPNGFDMEQCNQSWGYSGSRRFIDMQDLRKSINTK